ncbi:MAG: HAD-IC family P-type ATPase, partial [Dehalococcoidia bacterium]|nr:HAD-IC family P-type ATPase [Dehalococcoidia bacterium]
VEGLARVDVVCVDKTGTLTETALVFDRLEALGSEAGLTEALGALASTSSSSNPTLTAIAKAFPPPGAWRIEEAAPFSSARKWSGASFAGKGAWVLGAPEVLLEGDPDEELRTRVSSMAQSGLRVLLLSHTENKIVPGMLPVGLRPVALALLEEQLRPDAAATVQYFYEQGVTIKVISGDNPGTVASVAARAGVRAVGEPVDSRTLPEDPKELALLMENRTVFGRVTPHQKRRMVEALQANGHVVAMTGDGVNDVLALKAADIAIAMGSGAAATKAVAQLILLDGRFATLPSVVAEGRRVMSNIERVANLFLAKTAYVALLAVAIAAVGWPFPLLPRHLTLIDSLTIGIPAFFLAFASKAPRYRPGFVSRVLWFTLPAGFLAASAAFAGDLLSHLDPGSSPDQSRTVVTLVLTVVGLWVLVILARPLVFWRRCLVGGMALGLGIAMAAPPIRQFFALDLPGWMILAQTMGVAVGAIILLQLAFGWRGAKWRLQDN